MKNLVLGTLSLFSMYANATVIYVDASATGGNNGTTWTDAYTLLQTATSAAEVGDEIWIAAGTYKRPDADPRGNSITWSVDDLKLYGGFEGGETDLNMRDWVANETIISGNIGDAGNPYDNSFTVLRGAVGADHKTYYLVDGIIIQDGYSNNEMTVSQRMGGAVFIGDPIDKVEYRNCVFRNNSALSGGAVAVLGSSVEMEVNFINCQFIGNYARLGAPFDISSNGEEKVTVNMINCLIAENEVVDFSGGLVGLYGHGGRVMAYNGTDISANFINTTWVDNEDASSSTDKITLGLVEAYDESTSEVYIKNCIFSGNTGSDQDFYAPVGGSIRYVDNVNVENLLTEDAAIEADTESGVIVGSPSFVNAAADDYRLTETSEGVDDGDLTAIGDLIPTLDLNGDLRLSGVNIDLGCYEFQAASGLNSDQLVALKLYPNPALNWISIETDSQIINSEVVDLNGQVLSEFGSALTIDLTALKAGHYLIKVITKDGISVQRVVKL